MTKRQIKEMKETQVRNLTNKFIALFKNIYDIEGLEYGVKNYFMDKLIETGKLAAFKLEINKAVEPMIGFGTFAEHGRSWNRQPIKVQIVPEFEYDKIPKGFLEVGKDVVLLNLDIIPMHFINEYVQTIVDIKATIRTNLQVNKVPFILRTTNPKSITAMQKLLEDETVVYVDDNTIEVLPSNSPYLIDKLNQYVKDVESELLTILGIDNVKHEKAAQMNVDEVNSNNDEINAYQQIILSKLKDFFKEIGEVLGFDLKVVENVPQVVSIREDEQPTNNDEGDEEEYV